MSLHKRLQTLTLLRTRTYAHNYTTTHLHTYIHTHMQMMAVAAKNTAVQKEEEVDENARQFFFAEEAARVQAQTKQIENTSRPNVKYSNDYQRPEPTTPDVDQLHLM